MTTKMKMILKISSRDKMGLLMKVHAEGATQKKESGGKADNIMLLADIS